MTIAKNTNKAKQAIANAKEIRCYSLENNFSGDLIADKPVIWGGEPINNQYRQLIEVSQSEFLTRELNSRHSKLTVGENGSYTLHVHSNLWYRFTATETETVCLCGAPMQNGLCSVSGCVCSAA